MSTKAAAWSRSTKPANASRGDDGIQLSGSTSRRCRSSMCAICRETQSRSPTCTWAVPCAARTCLPASTYLWPAIHPSESGSARRRARSAIRMARSAARWSSSPSSEPSRSSASGRSKRLIWTEMGRSPVPGDALPLLFYADGYKFPDVYHTTKLLTPDPIIVLEEVEELVVVASSLEEGRARAESRATQVRNANEFGAQELASKNVIGTALDAAIIKNLLDERGVHRVAVPPYFPIGLAERLRAGGVELVVATDLPERRRAKRPDQVEAIEAAQRATEDAWRAGIDAIRRATVRPDATLELDGAVFTAERLRAIVETVLLERGYASDGAICAPGPQSANPHQIGTGPLHANEPIVMDIFPQHKKSRYWADMT